MKRFYLGLLVILFSLSCSKDEAVLEAFITENNIKSMTVRLMDSSDSKSASDVDFQGLEIDLLQVRIKTEGDSNSTWLDLETNTGIYDLVDLQFGEDSIIAEGTFVGDSLKEIRLILGDENHVLVDSVWYDISIPSGSQSGLKIKLNPAIYIESLDSLMIDFDSDASVREQGNGSYKLQPVVRVVD